MLLSVVVVCVLLAVYLACSWLTRGVKKVLCEGRRRTLSTAGLADRIVTAGVGLVCCPTGV